MFTLNEVSKKYQDKIIFEIDQMQLPTTGFVVIRGESGSGKTTFVNCFSGIDSFTEGNIYFNDDKVDTRKMSTHIFQDFQLIEYLSVYENLLLIAQLHHQNINRIPEILAKLHIDDLQKQPVNTLSGGQKQRVAIARAILIEKHIIIADEPTANLDGEHSRFVYQALKELSEKCLVIVATHDDLVEQFSPHQTYTIHQGKIKLLSSIQVLKRDKFIENKGHNDKPIRINFALKIITKSGNFKYFLRMFSAVMLLLLTGMLLLFSFTMHNYSSAKFHYSEFKKHDIQGVFIESLDSNSDVNLYYPEASIWYSNILFRTKFHGQNIDFRNVIIVDYLGDIQLGVGEVVISDDLTSTLTDISGIQSHIGTTIETNEGILVIKNIVSSYYGNSIFMSEQTFNVFKSNSLVQSTSTINSNGLIDRIMIVSQGNISQGRHPSLDNEIVVSRNMADHLKTVYEIDDVLDMTFSFTFENFGRNISKQLTITGISNTNFIFTEYTKLEIIHYMGSANLEFGKAGVLIFDYNLSDIYYADGINFRHNSMISDNLYSVSNYLISWTNLVLYLNLIILIITILFMYIYSNFSIETKMKEFGIVLAYTNSKRNIMKIFITEYFLLFLLTSISIILVNIWFVQMINFAINDYVLGSNVILYSVYPYSFISIIELLLSMLLLFSVFVILPIKKIFSLNVLDIIYNRK